MIYLVLFIRPKDIKKPAENRNDFWPDISTRAYIPPDIY